jgi:hypothetical protein
MADLTWTTMYSPELIIRNTDALPAGTGCRYLLCIRGQGEELVAKQWCRKMPAVVKPSEVIVKF